MKSKTKKDKSLKRIHQKSILFNTKEINAINKYCKKYKIKNRSKFMREAIISTILQKFEEDPPSLFEDQPSLAAQPKNQYNKNK